MDNRKQCPMEFRKFKERKQINPIDTEQLSEFYLDRTRPDVIAWCICCVM